MKFSLDPASPNPLSPLGSTVYPKPNHFGQLLGSVSKQEISKLFFKPSVQTPLYFWPSFRCASK
jgi:hypothetical protein